MTFYEANDETCDFDSLGFLSMLSSVAVAITYSVKPASFPVFVDGKELKCKQQTLVVNGVTYLPLQAVAGALNVPVKWNAESKRVEIGKAVSPAVANGTPIPMLYDGQMTATPKSRVQPRRRQWQNSIR